MDAKIREFIERQRSYIDRYYDLPPEERRKAEAMLERLEQLGRRCRTGAEFRRQFTP